MTESPVHQVQTGDELLLALVALANPQRLRIVAALTPGRNYVSQLARELRIGRPLLYLHLQKLQTAGLVRGHLELSGDGKAMKYFEVSPFALELTPARIAEAVVSLTEASSPESNAVADPPGEEENPE